MMLVDPSKRRSVAMDAVKNSSHRTAGFWSYRSDSDEKGALHLDGGADSPTFPKGFTSANSTRHTYAHEMAHALDGRREHSTTEKWMLAWESEVKSGELSDYGATNPIEGFAEFGRLVWTNPREARDSFPQCWAYWKEQGWV
jgi:hypothetical protein